MGIIDNYKFFAYSLFGFAAFVGVIKLFAPKNFSGIIKTITEILMFLVIASLFIKPQYFSINDIKEYKKKDYSDTYNLLQQEAINKELEGIVSEKLCEEGIIPIGIRIDISISDNKLNINGCYIKITEDYKALFLKKEKSLEEYFGFPFYETEEEGINNEGTDKLS